MSNSNKYIIRSDLYGKTEILESIGELYEFMKYLNETNVHEREKLIYRILKTQGALCLLTAYANAI